MLRVLGVFFFNLSVVVKYGCHKMIFLINTVEIAKLYLFITFNFF